MKWINKYIFLIAGILVGSLMFADNVFASTLNYDHTGYYWQRNNPDGTKNSWYLEDYYVDGEVAYCIEPGVPEGNPMNSGSWEQTGLSDSIKDRITLIAYYGYTYPGHQTLQYRAATQAMIWETIMGSGSSVTFSTQRWNAGTSFDVSNERNEIERLISNHRVLPSFANTVYSLQVGQSITLTDTNNVLSDYDVKVSNADYTINGNNITITPTASGSLGITFTKKVKYTSGYKLFIGNGIQNMIVPGAVDPVSVNVLIKSYYGKVQVNKTDSETTTAQGQASLKGAIYGVYNLNNNLITQASTNENGELVTDSVIAYGSYYLQEIKASTGYLLDNNKYYFDMKGEDTKIINVKEKVIKNYISILKQYDYVDGTTQFLNAESNITFEIFYPNGEKYGEVKTDKNGYATINIPYGVWKFHQVNTNAGYEKIYDFYITVDENSEQEQYYNILNNKLSAYLQVFKVDSETGNKIALADTTFKILNTDTNQYVSQYVAGKVYSEFKTDSTGRFITYLKLESGNYRLIEISSPNGYLINKDGVDFTIGNDTHFNYTTYGAFITLDYENTPIKGQVEINKVGENIKIENGSYSYETNKELSGVVYNIYADEDIKSADGNYIYYNKGDLVDTITTNDNGYAISKKLPLGKYYLIEIETNDSYKLDTTEYHFELKEIDNNTAIVYITYKATNELKKGTLEFTKTDLVNGDVIPNTKIEIYTEDDKLIYTGVTDEKGKVVINDLVIGKYYIIETNPATGYVINTDKLYFEIKEDGSIEKANMTNKPITGILEFSKVDISTSEPLPNTLIEIYNDNDELIYSGRTDENGQIKIDELRYGKYYILEKEAPEGYELNTEKMYFEITEDGEIVKSVMEDKIIEIHEVPNTEANEFPIEGLITIILIGLGAGACVYANKNKKK